MKKVLFSRENACVAPLRALMETQKHRTLVLWALDCAQPMLALFESRVVDDARPREALAAAGSWMRGEIKMPVARKAILAAHRAAGEAGDPIACAAARAIGHAAATVHVETHAMGLVMYGLTALAFSLNPGEAEAVAAAECQRYCDRLLYWQEHVDTEERKWASFLLRDDVPNKERLLREKAERRGQLLSDIKNSGR